MVKVSVIIPVYNVENYLAECLDSIVNQTLKDIEIICINDGSTDNSLEILETYAKNDNRIKVCTQENSGLSASRNHGIRLSRGEFIYFIDSDDILELNALEALYNMSNALDLDILIFKLINFDDGTHEKYTSDYYEMSFLKPFAGRIFNYNKVGERILDVAVSIPGKFFKKSLIFSMKFPEGLIFEDNYFFAEAMLKAKRISFLDKHFYNRRIRNDSITTIKTIKFADSIVISNKIMDLFKEFGVYNQFKKRFIEKKINSAYNRFSQVDEVFKDEFFNRIKEDFKSHKKEFHNDYVFLEKVNPRHRYIFNEALKAENYKEFELNVGTYIQKQKNRALSKKKKRLKKDIKKYEKLNKELMKSNSWKITKPLRKIMGVFRND
ncbi:MAG: glycosyltransferase [Methanobrevibacter ruminantium]|uniref:glycosyltransferase family 2 protein n=1 Tax=Methanobrevibacter ruminantium TaxID=83816 RepID=UPI002D7E18CD|nr:glycosyltransferase family 2 protein [Methanobrevibacter ruminantium]MCI5737767.1 glycosyltransferase [Methanobrevibacter ruminantium]